LRAAAAAGSRSTRLARRASAIRAQAHQSRPLRLGRALQRQVGLFATLSTAFDNESGFPGTSRTGLRYVSGPWAFPQPRPRVKGPRPPVPPWRGSELGADVSPALLRHDAAHHGLAASPDQIRGRNNRDAVSNDDDPRVANGPTLAGRCLWAARPLLVIYRQSVYMILDLVVRAAANIAHGVRSTGAGPSRCTFCRK